ncbi:HD domain-containing phosphohydrolase [Bradyrhizobium sp. Tv2a-2]|uniref:HD-GYP domain-containing protein n=1 Tax=Bradyrhizobium sp. Tv2a-2 TaxID=113395 RepID=UPI0004236074|nr:HD domain-containing phosphohydrolase [Bradyrhizobium sp. Tv2a-2]
MPVHVVADDPAKLVSVRKLLEPRFAVTSELLRGASVQRGDVTALVIRADLRTLENIHALKKIIRALSKVRKRVFLVDATAHLHVSQAYALGATRVLLGPLDRTTLFAELSEPVAGGEAAAGQGQGSQVAAAVGEAALASMFTAVATGLPIDIQSARSAGSHIADSIAETGLADWLTTVRRHHEGTYQHCLLVTGIAVDFGLSLGVTKADIERLYSAAMFHDVGKAKIPLEILDKPGKLDDHERALIETHPVAGYEVLKNNNQVSPEILDAVRHHHEYLDGSGYPDGLSNGRIADIVRILTISDIFAALIENRRYRSPMSREDAYGILKGMHGKLEKPLVAAFRDVALNR